jgi:hypothetical protein
MASPLYGSQFIGKMNTPVFMKLYDSSDTVYGLIASAATATALDALINGTNESSTYTLVTNTADKYFTFRTPERNFAIGNGSFTEPSGFTKVTFVIGSDIAGSIAAIKTALLPYNAYVRFADVDSDEFRLTAANGGACNAGTIGDYGASMTVVRTTSSVGSFAKIGKLVNDMALNPEMTSIEDSEGGTNKTGVKYNPQFNLMNVNQTNHDTIMNDFDGQAVDLVFYDNQDDRLQVFALRDVPCNAILDPLGDVSKIMFNMTKVYASRQLAGKRIYKTFESLA